VFVESVQDVLAAALEPASGQPDESDAKPSQNDIGSEFSKTASTELTQEII
jgi:hypothetical protein